MKWFILVVMMGMHPDGTQDTFVYHDPVLQSLEECQRTVYDRSFQIRRDMFLEFNGKSIDSVYCIEEEKLKEFFNIIKGGTDV